MEQEVKQSLARRETLSFAGWKMDDDPPPVLSAMLTAPKNLTFQGAVGFAKSVSNLTSISLWGMTGITDKVVIQLISRANSLQHLNVGGAFITDESLQAIADCCPLLKVNAAALSPEEKYCPLGFRATVMLLTVGFLLPCVNVANSSQSTYGEQDFL